VETGNNYNMAIAEQQSTHLSQFFQIELPDGSFAYTRDGNFHRNVDGFITTTDGFRLSPGVTIADAGGDVQITPEGRVTQRLPGETEFAEMGRINLYRFINPSGLEPLGQNLWRASDASGEPQEGLPTEDGFGSIQAGFLEMSNVDAISEMVNMIAAQRAYEFNSRSIQTSDEMLQTINQLKR
jgi:flagellar basal-body rod protein FlgG